MANSKYTVKEVAEAVYNHVYVANCSDDDFINTLLKGYDLDNKTLDIVSDVYIKASKQFFINGYLFRDNIEQQKLLNTEQLD